MAQALDELDRSIVVILQGDGRASNVEIARQLGYSEATVRKRLERLLESGVIRVTALLDPAKVNLTMPIVVGIEADLSAAQQIAEHLAALPEVCSVKLVTGAYDLLVDAVLSSNDQLLPFLVDRVAAIPGVKRTETLHVLKTVKQACEWGLSDIGDTPPRKPGDVIPGAIVVPS
jgi:Lrp/AsnC family transcriptional regulator for asnA, asnC and gidA